MALPAYYFPNSTLKAQAASSAAWQGGLAVPVWICRQVYTYEGGSFTLLPLPPGGGTTDGSYTILTDDLGNPIVDDLGNPIEVSASVDGGYTLLTDDLGNPIVDDLGNPIEIPVVVPISSKVSRNGFGYFGAAADGTQGLWVSANAGILTYLPFSGTASGFVVALAASGEALVGLAVAGVATGGNNAYAVGADGQVFITSSASPSSVTTLSPGFNTLCKGATTDGINLYTTNPATSNIGIMSLAGHAFSTVAGVFSRPGIIAASPTPTAVASAGWSLAVLASGAIDFVAAPNSMSTLAAFANSSNVALLAGNDPTWNISSVATGITSCAGIAWNPDGSQVLASVATGVTVYGIVAGALTFRQTINFGGAGSIGVTSDGKNALVCAASGNTVKVLVNTLDIWSSGTPFSVTNPTSVLMVGASSAWIVSNTNVYPATRAGNIWTLGTALPLGFTGVALGQDAYGNVYVTGGTGTSGHLSMISLNAIVSTVSWSGAGYGIGITCAEGQVAVLLSDNQTIRTFSGLNNAVTSQGVITSTAPTGCSFMGSTPESVWLCGSSAMWQGLWSKPYTISRYRVGQVQLYDGSGFGSYALGIGHDPSALAWDASGNFWCATTENDLYSFAGTRSGSNLTLLTYENIPVYAGQVATTPMGISSLTWFQNGLYASTLFPGALIQVQ